jgi:hypothetical protein
MTAVGLLGQGMDGVTIADEAGRVYTHAEFTRFYREDEAQYLKPVFAQPK